MTHYETALVTGGTTGIGEALVRALVASGTKVVVNARNAERLEALVSELGEDKVIGIPADVSDPRVAEQVVRDAEAKLGHIDLVIANAGTGYNVKGKEITVDAIVGVFQLNVMGATATIAAAVQKMVERKKGHLVGITSVAANRGLPTSAAYCGSKAGFGMFLESLRVDLQTTGVHVTEIRPGFVDTPLTKKNKFDMPFLMGPDRAAELILRALARRKKVYTFPWQMAVASFALRRIPNWLFDFAAGKAPV